jgi:hypothetical protein
VPSEETYNFPLVVKDGNLLNDSAPLAPFVIVVSWRSTRSTWLPQIPALIFSSAKSLRLLDSAKMPAHMR